MPDKACPTSLIWPLCCWGWCSTSSSAWSPKYAFPTLFHEGACAPCRRCLSVWLTHDRSHVSAFDRTALWVTRSSLSESDAIRPPKMAAMRRSWCAACWVRWASTRFNASGVTTETCCAPKRDNALVVLITQHRYLYGACGMCVMRFGYSSVTRNSTALLQEWSGCLMQYCSSNNSMSSVSAVPRISTVLLVSLFTAVR